jgi:hypothetical protein
MSQLKVDIILKYINNTISDEFSAVNYTVGIDNEMTKDRKRERVLTIDGRNIVNDTSKVTRKLSKLFILYVMHKFHRITMVALNES